MLTQPTLLALSGPSSCGKTTLARLLARVFPRCSILHADDYYLPDSQIPVHNGVLDWDCAEAIDTKRLVTALKRIKAGETVVEVRDGLATTETPEAKGVKNVVDEELLGRLRHEITTWEMDTKEQKHNWDIRDQLDIKILLRSRYEDSKRRREAREGYDTLEGYWQDPPGYFDQIVWPNFVKNHDAFFQDGDVQGHVNEAVAKSLGIHVVPGMGQRTLEETLQYV